MNYCYCEIYLSLELLPIVYSRCAKLKKGICIVIYWTKFDEALLHIFCLIFYKIIDMIWELVNLGRKEFSIGVIQMK